MRKWKTTTLLYFDDIDKGPHQSERLESEFFDLLETRTSNLRPTLWTSQLSLSQLEKRFSAGTGPAIARRLAEFTGPILKV